MTNSEYIAEQNANWASRPVLETGVFHHDCTRSYCTNIVVFDDEPYCFTHSPDSGSSVRGYSARQAARLETHLRHPYAPCAWCNNVECHCM
jgi:hypothetical protein